MRRVFVLTCALFLVTAVPISPLGAREETARSSDTAAPEELLISPNVKLLNTIPSPGTIGARFRDGFMYVTTTAGLTIYDVKNPAAPVEVGRLVLPHFENEDVDLGGDILLISNDAAESTGILFVIDISDPTKPTLLSQLQMGGNPALGGPGHTASCIARCKFAWVTNGGLMKVIDLRNPAAPVDKGNFDPLVGGLAVHDVQTDGNGLAWVAGYNGTAIFRIPSTYTGGLKQHVLVSRTNRQAESTYEKELGLGDGSSWNDFIHHNSRRLKDRSVAYITEEDYTRPGCRGAGSFQTWRTPVNSRGIPNGKLLTPLDKWETELVRDQAAPAAVCSAHYFDVDHNVVAQGWYEQGTRLLDVSDPKNVRQIGYFVPPTALTWGAYFVPTDKTRSTIYVLDASRGIDVLKFTRPSKGALSAPYERCGSQRCLDANRVTKQRAPVRNSWRVGTPALTKSRFGWACRISGATT